MEQDRIYENRDGQINPFRGSEFERMMIAQDQLNIPRTALFFDIDKTFRMKGDVLNDVSRKLAVTAWEANIPIVAVTGVPFHIDRTAEFNPVFNSVEERIAKGDLPYFPVIYTDAGTRRWILNIDQATGKRHYLEDKVYKQKLIDQGFERTEIVSQLNTLINVSEDFKKVNFRFQRPEDEQTFLNGQETPEPFKVSGYFNTASSDQALKMQNLLQQMYPNLRVAVGIDMNDSSNTTYWADILPIDKHEALYELRQFFGIKIAIRAGDSPNDKSMLIEDVNLKDRPDLLKGAVDIAILVGGAENSVKEEIENAIDISNKGKRKTGSYEITTLEDERKKLFYRETAHSKRLGPESIVRGLQIFLRKARRDQSKDAGNENNEKLYAVIEALIEKLKNPRYSLDAEKKIYEK